MNNCDWQSSLDNFHISGYTNPQHILMYLKFGLEFHKLAILDNDFRFQIHGLTYEDKIKNEITNYLSKIIIK